MDSIKKNYEFTQIYNTNKKYFSKYFILYIIKNNLNENRLGVVASKKTGNAVVRNRLKRLFREIVRKNEKNLKNFYDIILIAKNSAGKNVNFINYEILEKDFVKILSKGNFFNE